MSTARTQRSGENFHPKKRIQRESHLCCGNSKRQRPGQSDPTTLRRCRPAWLKEDHQIGGQNPTEVDIDGNPHKREPLTPPPM